MLADSAMPRGNQIRHSRSPRASSATMRLNRPRWARPPSRRRPRKRGSRSEAGGMRSSLSWSHMPSKSTPRVPPLAPGFRRRLLAWFRRHGRDLAWRKTRDPYRVLISEVMLQQTPVSRVQEYYPRFLDRFPTLRHLAEARPGRVREEWDGLGYYRRAANLHRPAREAVDREDGGAPARGAPRPGAGGVGRARLLPAGCQPAPPGPRGRGPVRREDPGPGGRAAPPPGHRALHRGRRRELRVRARGAGGGHQRGAGAPPRVPSPPRVRRARRADALGHRGRHSPGAGKDRVGVQPGDHGAGGDDLYGPGGEVRGVPGAERVQDGTAVQRSSAPDTSAVTPSRPVSMPERAARSRSASNGAAETAGSGAGAAGRGRGRVDRRGVPARRVEPAQAGHGGQVDRKRDPRGD